MSKSRMRAPVLTDVATVRGARGAPGPTLMRARSTMNEPTSVPMPHAILTAVSFDEGRNTTVGNSYGGSSPSLIFPGDSTPFLSGHGSPRGRHDAAA